MGFETKRTPGYRAGLKRIIDKSPEAQSEAFIKAARELGCDESEERFDEVLKKVARHKPAETKPPRQEKAKDG